MRELTLQEISNLDSGEIIPSFRATIKKVFDQATGQGQFGTWFAQGMELSEGSQTIHATWFGEYNLKELEGQTRLFESSETKHGLRGLSWDVKKKNGKQYEGIKITEVAKIKPMNGGDATSSNHRPTTSNAAPTSEPESAAKDRSHRIERQHSQEMALRAIAINNYEPTKDNIRRWTDYFQVDLDNLPVRERNDKAEEIPGKGDWN